MTRAQILRELTNKDFNPLKPLTVGKDGRLLLNSNNSQAVIEEEIDISTLFDEPQKQEEPTKKKRIRVNGKFVKSL